MTRLTELGDVLITVPPRNALLHLVDVDDDTETDDGSSKIIEVENLLAQDYGLISAGPDINFVVNIITPGVFVDLDMVTTLDPASRNFIQFANGEIQYTGPSGFNARIRTDQFMQHTTAGERGAETRCVVAGTPLPNTYSGSIGDSGAGRFGIWNATLNNNDIIRIQMANPGDTIDFRLHFFFLEISAR